MVWLKLIHKITLFLEHDKYNFVYFSKWVQIKLSLEITVNYQLYPIR